MVFYDDVQPTLHYLENHEKDVPWHRVVELIFKVKNPRKKGDKFEIEYEGYYVLFEIRDGVLFVINAKVTR